MERKTKLSPASLAKIAEAQEISKSLVPLYDRIVVFPDPIEVVTTGGILLIPDNVEKNASGTVLQVGPGDTKPLYTKEGDRVLYSKFAGTDLPFEGLEFKLFRESDILCIVEPKVISKPVKKAIKKG